MENDKGCPQQGRLDIGDHNNSERANARKEQHFFNAEGGGGV